MRVGNVILETRVGGPQRRIAQVGSRLLEHGVETVVFFPDEPEAEGLEALLAEHGLRGRRLTLRRFTLHRGWVGAALALATLAPQALRLARALQAERCDIIHVNGIHQPHGALAGRIAGLAVVWQMNDCLIPPIVSRPLAELAWRTACRIPVAVEAAGRHHFPGRFDRDRARFPLLYAPVDVTRFQPDGPRIEKPAGKKVVLTVGNLSAIKGTDLFLDAAESILHRRRDVVFWVVGELLATQRQFWTPLQQRVHARMGSEIRLLGRRGDVDQLMRSADLYVCSSRSEACPMSVLEAMASERPVVATSVGGVPELVRDSHEGILVPPTAQGIERGILELLDDADARRAMGAAGLARVFERFTTEHAVQSHLEIYRMGLRR